MADGCTMQTAIQKQTRAQSGTHIKCIEDQQFEPCAKNNAMPDFHFLLFNSSCKAKDRVPFIQSSRLLKERLIPSTLFHNRLKLHSAEKVSHFKWCCCCNPKLNMRYKKGLSPHMFHTSDLWQFCLHSLAWRHLSHN